MKGLDGIQGPIYVGTGCVFRRQALYGFDAPRKNKSPTNTCNCWLKCCEWCCMGKRKKRKLKKSKFKKMESSHKKVHCERSTSENALKCIELGTKGELLISSICQHIIYSTILSIVHAYQMRGVL